MNDLERSVLAAIAWFDLFDYPLTGWEVGKWLLVIPAPYRSTGRAPTGIQKEYENRGGSFGVFSGSRNKFGMTVEASESVFEKLEHLVREGKLERKWGYYFLPGREEIIETRQRRYLLAREKFERARRVARWLRCVPFVRLVAVCNTLGYSNAAEESDIDLFLIVAPGKIWTVRGLCLVLLKLFHLRPLLVRFGALREERKDRIDLSFFITLDALDISALALASDELGIMNDELGDTNIETVIPNSRFFIRDPYLAYWLAQLTPLYDHGGVYEKFWKANETLRTTLSSAPPYDTSPLRAMRASLMSRLLQKAFEFVFSGTRLESVLKSIQKHIMPARIKDLAGYSDGVVVSDTVLKFHDIDRRAEYRRTWIERLRAFTSI